MSVMRLLIMSLFIFSRPSVADMIDRVHHRGIILDGAIGLPAITIKNPDGTSAGYGGTSLQARLLIPLVDNRFKLYLNGTLRYHDLKNAYSNSQETEVANHIGPGAGLTIEYSRFFLGAEYMMMKARHYYVGPIGVQSEYDYTYSNAFVGYYTALGPLGLGLSYSVGSGVLEHDKVGLTSDADISEQTVWFHIRFSTDKGLGRFLSEVFN